jgi:glycosyltransferase involved in cell wall biosynthesis
MKKAEISIIIPCYNEADTIKSTLNDISGTLEKSQVNFEIIVVDDASSDQTSGILKRLTDKTIRTVTNPFKIGYGASIKVGIENSKFSWIGICDGDGTYPVKKFSDFLKYTGDYDMVVGERTGKIRSIPLLRRPAKWFLNRFSSYLAGRKIKDVNSGMRIFKKAIAYRYWDLFPDGFSFTTTLTLSAIMGHYGIKNIPINYMKRSGKSKLNPFRDTYNFFLLILRISMLFNPLRVFMPGFFIIFGMTLISLTRDIINVNLTDTTVMLFIFSMIIMMMGLLADLINKSISKQSGK